MATAAGVLVEIGMAAVDVLGSIEDTSMLESDCREGDGEVCRPLLPLRSDGDVFVEPSVSGGVGMWNWVPLRFRGFLVGESSTGAGRLRGLCAGEGSDESISSMVSVVNGSVNVSE